MFGLEREEALSDIAFDQTNQQSNKQIKVQMPYIAPGAMRTVEFFILINSLDFSKLMLAHPTLAQLFIKKKWKI